jgi:hypothetical protein
VSSSGVIIPSREQERHRKARDHLGCLVEVGGVCAAGAYLGLQSRGDHSR